MKNMNLPNRLTLLRIILVPFVIAAILIDFPFHFTVAGLLFGAAAITDAFDGKIARRDHLITDFGKFADPLADKILVISVLVCFVKCGLCGAIPPIIIIFREFTVTSVRLVAASKGTVIAANLWGKVKTVCQIIAIVAVFVFQTAMDIISLVLCGIVLPTREYSPDRIALSVIDGHQTLYQIFSIFNIIAQAMLWITAIITVISGVKYLVDNKEVIRDV